MTLWDKGYKIDREVKEFTVGNDYQLDQELIIYDCEASKAHAKTLQKAGILSNEERRKIIRELDNIKKLAQKGEFKIRPEQEDCHTAIEEYLTKKLGKTGEKIHTGRSRNDQVLAAIRLYEKEELKTIIKKTEELIRAIKEMKKKYGRTELPGYTHTRKAMATTIREWAGAFEESLNDDKKLISNIISIIDQSPLGSGAGFGIPIIKLDNQLTAKNAGFKKAMKSPQYAQLSRGKFEAIIINALTNLLLTINRMSSDIILYSNSHYQYFELPREICTGSSIMPQKKNPDLFELTRAEYHNIIGEEIKVKTITANLITGYHRDLQLTKEPIIKSITRTKKVLEAMKKGIEKIKVNKEACKKALTKELRATEEAYKLVKKGKPFREAYKEIGKKYK